MFGKSKRNSTPAPSADQRIAQINYQSTVSSYATFALNGAGGPDPRQIQDAIDGGRAAGIPSEQLAKDADAMRTWGNGSR